MAKKSFSLFMFHFYFVELPEKSFVYIFWAIPFFLYMYFFAVICYFLPFLVRGLKPSLAVG